jgi:hypothetical protein
MIPGEQSEAGTRRRRIAPDFRYWCDPSSGCYTVGGADFSNQFEVSGGIVIRF